MSGELQTNQPGLTGAKKASHAPIDGQGLKDLIEAGLTWLRTNQATVNALNVFPVPDGDTGTNMVLTMQAAYNEIVNSGEKNAGKLAHAVAQGALMGARGNSGVILSQLWRGFARGLDTLDRMDTTTLARALDEGRKTAYKGVVRPVEGTILTVAKDVATAAQAALAQTDDLTEMLELIVEAADVSVRHTPELLPVLKSAGVVDSGGKGFFFILEGMLRHCKELALDTPLFSVQPLSNMDISNSMDAIEPGQDYEVVVDFSPFSELDLDRFYNDLAQIGTSIQVGEGEGIYRMHIHVAKDKREAPLLYTESIGTIKKVSMENLMAQLDEQNRGKPDRRLVLAPIEPGQIAVIAVSPGQGLSRIFASLGVAGIVEGGQTMNPSTEDILKSFENLPTEKVIILPNNKNIVLAAQTASTLTVKNVTVIPSQNVPQGLSAMLRLAPEGNLDDVVREMSDALLDVETGEITIATRSVELNGVSVEKGQVIALHNGKLVYAASTLEEAILGMLTRAHTAERERITLYYGDSIDKSEVNRLADKVRSAYPVQEIEVHEGGQPHYLFIISIE